jgi:hypothetical protein
MYIFYIADFQYSLNYRSNSKLLIIKSKVLALSLIVFLSSMLLLGIGSTAYTYAQGQPSNQFPGSIIAFSNTDTTPHQLELGAIQQGDAEPNVNEPSLDITNTVSAQSDSQLLVFVTDNTIRVVEAKVKTAYDQFIDLVPSTQANAFSPTNFPPR